MFIMNITTLALDQICICFLFLERVLVWIGVLFYSWEFPVRVKLSYGVLLNFSFAIKDRTL